MKVKTNYCDSEYLTLGKVYEVTEIRKVLPWGSTIVGNISDDYGTVLTITLSPLGCHHIGYLIWEVIET